MLLGWRPSLDDRWQFTVFGFIEKGQRLTLYNLYVLTVLTALFLIVRPKLMPLRWQDLKWNDE